MVASGMVSISRVTIGEGGVLPAGQFGGDGAEDIIEQFDGAGLDLLLARPWNNFRRGGSAASNMLSAGGWSMSSGSMQISLSASLPPGANSRKPLESCAASRPGCR